MELQYKTRGMVSPRGKPRIYFACQDQDFSALLEPISGLLLKAANCAVFYRLPSQNPDGEYEDLLSDMQMAVIPVTSRLLTKDCQARRDLQFFLDSHIPVLPLLEEEGIEARFNGVCGNLQCLNRFQKDSTALQFEKKLVDFMGDVLIGGEVEEKIRAAFDAYVFLSYRKKDRALANRLMRLIHEDPDARDIAVWYDEYLVPGEDFNDSIQKALEKSDLFVLTVTPSLAEPENYIERCEYPNARKAGKPVVPVLMAPTDRETLGQYEDLPEWIWPEQMSGFLRENVERIAKEEKRGDPRHDYFIGLAYMGGIDVEVDRKRGIRLIRSAAESGCADAMYQMACFCRQGQGVDRDPEQALQWFRRHAAAREQQWNREPCAESCQLWLSALDTLSDSLLAQYRQEEAEAVLGRGIEAAEALENQYPEIAGCLGGYWISLGKIRAREEKPEQEASCYERALAIREKLAERDPEPENQRDLALCCQHLGCCREKDQPDRAEALFQRAQALLESVFRETGGADCQDALAAGWDVLGNFYSRRCRFREARAAYDRGLELRQELNAQREDPQKDPALWRSFQNLGALCQLENRTGEALNFYGQALDRCRRCEDGTVESRKNVALCLWNLGNLQAKLGDQKSGKASLVEATELFRKITRDADIPENRRYLGRYLNNLGGIYWDWGRFPEAVKTLRKALKLRQELADLTREPEDRLLLAQTCQALGDCAVFQGCWEEGRSWYEQALKLCQTVQRTENTPEVWEALAECARRLGYLSHLQKKKEDAERQFRRALDLRRQAEKLRGSEDPRALSGDYNNLGTALKAMGRHREALTMYRRALRLRQELAQASGLAEDRHQLADSLYNLGTIKEELEKPREAREVYEEAMSIWEQLYEHTETLGILNGLSDCGNTLANMMQMEGNRADAIAIREKITPVMLKAARIREEMPGWTRILRNLTELGALYLETGNKKSSLEAYSYALTLALQMNRAFPSRVGYAQNITMICRQICPILEEQGELKQADEYYRMAINGVRPAAMNGPVLRGLLSKCYEEYGEFCRRTGRPEEARQMLDQAGLAARGILPGSRPAGGKAPKKK